MRFEWVSVLNPTVEQDDEVGLAGTALKPDVSGADLPFTHPFGNDFEFTIVPDPSYNGLLASANKDPTTTRTGTAGQQPVTRASPFQPGYLASRSKHPLFRTSTG